MRFSFLKMILLLGFAGIGLGITRYMHQEAIISNVIKQFQHSPLSSMKFFIFVDEQNDDPEVLLNSLEKFLKESKALPSNKKISVSVITSSRTPEKIKNSMEALQQKYSSFYKVESARSLLIQEKNFDIPQFIIDNPDEELSQKVLKLLLLNSNEQAVFISSANMFPYAYEPLTGKNHLNNALLKVKAHDHGIVFCQIYTAPPIIGSTEIFFIDQQFLLRCLPCLQVKILNKLSLGRLSSAEQLFNHAVLAKNKRLTFEQYESSVEKCMTSYMKNPSLLLGTQALQKWAAGDIFYDQMAIEYKTVALLHQLTPLTTTQDRLIYKGCWSADVAKRFLKKDNISALIATIIIAQDYEAATQKQENQTDIDMIVRLYSKYRKQLTTEELYVLNDVCRNNSLEALYSSKISA